MLPRSHGRVSDIKAVKGVLEKAGKVMRGRKGVLDTRAQNSATGDAIARRGGTPTAGFGSKETRFGDGKKGTRYSNGSAIDAQGRQFEVQTVDVRAYGALTQRESDAAIDIAQRADGAPVVAIPKTKVN